MPLYLKPPSQDAHSFHSLRVRRSMLTIGAVLLSLLTASAVLAIVVEDSIRSHPHSDAGLSMETMP